MIDLTVLSNRTSFERKSREWRQTQKRLADQITEYQEAANDYVQDGIRLLELSKKAYFSLQTARFKRKTKIAQLRVFELNKRTTLSQRLFANRLIYLQLRIRLGKEKRPLVPIPATSVLSGSAGRTRTTRWAILTSVLLRDVRQQSEAASTR